MDLRVYHPDLTNISVTVNSSTVVFDENGVSEEISPVDYATFLRVPGYWGLEDWQRHLAKIELDVAVADLGTGDALPPEGEAPLSDDEGQPIPEHDEDLSLLENFQAVAPEFQSTWFNERPLMERLDLAGNPALDEATARRLFNTEKDNKKSKRVLSELDRRLVLIRKAQTAQHVTDAMIKANFPREEEH